MRIFIFVLAVCMAPPAYAADNRPFYEAILPANSIAVLSASDPAAMADAAGRSALGQMIGSNEHVASALANAMQRLQLLAALATGLPKEQSEALLKGGCAIALLPQADDSAGKHLPLLVCIDVSSFTAESRATLEKSLLSSIELILKAPPEPLGKRAYAIRLGEEEFAISFGSNTLVAGFKSEVTNFTKGPKLAESPLFAKVCEKVGTGKGISGYVNIAALIEELDRQRPDIERRENLQRLRADSFSAFGFRTSITATGEMIDRLFLVSSDRRKSWLHVLPSARRPLQAARFVPPQFDVLIAADIGPGDRVWDALRQAVDELWGAAGLEDFDNRNEGFEGPFGINLRDDFLACFDGEIFIAADLEKLGDTMAGGGGLMQLPMLIGFRARNQQVIASALDRVLESDVVWGQLGVEKRPQVRGKDKLVKLVSPFESGLSYGYAFVDDYFLFSPSSDILDHAVDAYRSGRSLAADAGLAKLKGRMPENANLECFVRTSVLCRELANAYRPHVDAGIQPVLKGLAAGAGKLADSMACVVIGDDGISCTARSPMGLALAAISLNVARDAAVRMRVHQTRQAFAAVSAALAEYFEETKQYPQHLEVLVPDFLAEVPEDPFGEWGLPIRYQFISRPAGDGTIAYGYVLASNGPDGKLDFNLANFDPLEWAAKLTSGDQPAINEVKAMLYQFRAGLHQDEAELYDEGDIVEVFSPKLGKEGTRK
ncbi:MAG TPA: hypothetical protein VM141_10030 [Planctomycetota bacterium]|nr:hypothetical protein [Planctomycetota bacterium]